VTKDYIQLTHGSGPMLLMTAATYGKPGANIVTTSPGYPQLTGAFAQRGGTIKYTPVGANLGYDFKAMMGAIDANTAIVYVCNPNNPTGVLADPAELRNFIMAVPENVLVFVDEAYLELANTDLQKNTMTPLVKLRKNLIVSRTFSKGYALAGFRVGYGTGHPEVLAKVRANDTGTAPSYLAAIAAQASVQDTEHLMGNIKKYRAVRDYTMKELDRLGLKHSDAQGAFVIFKAGIEAKEFQKKMLEKKIQVNTVFGVAPGQEGEYKDWIRVSIGTQEDMELFIGATASILGKS
jgi:histidinol-phosphate aminotransferase